MDLLPYVFLAESLLDPLDPSLHRFILQFLPESPALGNELCQTGQSSLEIIREIFRNKISVEKLFKGLHPGMLESPAL